ncbi:tRNA dihydrouridine(20/20a) synthase DusA [Deinococcus cellulosilyticus]|uniref:tRNA-dihydrouridine(20/20a) synthase n=1 Tax=Deinococcus cellulosilyticus (strain DSM 18568 / NBRC 106333 / KACC 11606 / 5516J-15) TaxID=1223518 RepID=A0A511N1W2_DEIC1|nr:tRNA dihydrouridine(20/20a) synthase DusA [Deinococcus cellulosilyticus]GEM46458.1 tRNA-dihydrouridine(20/20a) synthase [Deinococcus cellulosilyticus NBRC 106333 = KACC 11606]
MSEMKLNRRLSVAPMMDWTDRHDRYFLRLISQHTLMYTEMVTTGAILFGDQDRHLAFHPEEHPIAVQLGGSNPEDLAKSAAICKQYGYDEINLNVGCPSDRVQNGFFGACLMAKPELVRDCVQAMREAVSIPVTVKHRIGIDDLDSYELLIRFIETVREGGCTSFTVHARKAWLSGLSPKENREIPPLRYDVVYQLKKDFPDLEVIINGGILDLQQAKSHLEHVDGVMIGRAAYQNPYILALADQLLFGSTALPKTRREILLELMDYAAEQLEQGVYISRITRHILGLFQGKPGARAFKRHISEQAYKPGAGLEVLQDAMHLVPDFVLDERPVLEGVEVSSEG